MSLQRQVWFWVAAAAALGLALWVLGNVLLPFVGGLVIAYLLNPLANRLERVRVPRPLAAFILVGLLVLSGMALLLVIVPVLVVQVAGFLENLPDYMRRLQELAADPTRSWFSRALGQGLSAAEDSIDEIVKQSAGWATGLAGSIWTGGQAVISLFVFLVLMPVVAFYVLADWPRLVANVDALIPMAHRDTARRLAVEMDRAIAGFVRGQTMVCLVLGVFYAVMLTLVGLNFGLFIGLLSGLITFIPYVGSITGFVLSGGVALAQFWPDWVWIGVVLGVFMVGQFLESYVLVPKLVGDSAGLHPVWLLFALFAFGALFGFVGLLLAVPIAAALAVLVRYFAGRYRQSPLYTGEAPPPPAGEGPPLP